MAYGDRVVEFWDAATSSCAFWLLTMLAAAVALAVVLGIFIYLVLS